MLPNPEILTRKPDDDLDLPEGRHLDGATTAQPQYIPPDSSQSAWGTLTVFANKKVMFSDDLFLSQRLRGILTGLITEAGGRVVQDPEDCDMFVCKHRAGKDYESAARNCKDVGSLAWLYHLITQNEWTSPLRRLLHYPVPQNGLPGFEGMRITVSNYGGEARIYLENLIRACGATFTKTMKSDNTHLITARSSGEKCQAAADWNIAMVNHLWLEESYAKCQLLPVSKKHQHFPARTNLGEVIGQTFLDEGKVREAFYPPCSDDDKVAPSARKKRKLLDIAQDNASAEGLVDVDRGREFDVHRDEEAEARPAKKRAQPGITTGYSTPARVRGGQENDTPALSTGGRSAKSKALMNLHAIAPDIALYEKEKKRGKDGHGPWGGKRAADQIDKSRRARSSSPADTDGEETEKKKRRPELPDVELQDRDNRVRSLGAGQQQRRRRPGLFPNFKAWLCANAQQRKLRDLGVQIVQPGHPCDYLAAPNVVRTVKFLVAVAKGPTVVSTSFISTILETGKIPPVKKFLLEDRENEEKWNVKLSTTVARARAHRGKLLWTIPIYCTHTIRNGYENYKLIAEANGAIFKVYRARGGTTIKPTTREEDGGRAPDPVYLLSSDKPDEKALWGKFEEMARAGNMEPRIVAADWLLDVVLRQEVSFDEKFLSRNFLVAGAK